jgi:alpha-D-ribose 1-methylphosphonate 5-triphosphate synthase subunit PhnH
MISTENLRGFDDPVHDSQACFREALEALARPGSIRELSSARPAPGLCAAAAALALALADHDTPLWLSTTTQVAADYLRFHCGAPIAERPSEAVFAFLDAREGMPNPLDFAQGSETYPNASATLVLTVEALGEGDPLELSGPGIAERVTLKVRGLPPALLDYWRDAAHRFPRGLDVFLCSGKRLCGLPRTTRIEA